MTRRSSLTMIRPEDVRAAVGYKSTERVAGEFGVTARTVRRWLARGLPLYFGNPKTKSCVSLDMWKRFVATGRTAEPVPEVDAPIAARSSGRKPVRARPRRTGSRDRANLSALSARIRAKPVRSRASR